MFCLLPRVQSFEFMLSRFVCFCLVMKVFKRKVMEDMNNDYNVYLICLSLFTECYYHLSIISQ